MQPFPEQVLGWNVYTNQWEPKNVSGGVAESYVGSSGVIVSGSNIYMGGTGTLNQLNFTALVSQTANLLEVQNSSSAVISYIDASGNQSGISASYPSGITLSSGIPSVITNKLYASGTMLHWNGSAINNTSSSGNILTGNVVLNGTISGVLSNTNLATIDSTPYSSGDCVKYIVKAKYGTAVQASEILITSDGTDSYMTEYGLIYTSGLLADISTSFSSSNIVLSAQATNSNTSIHMFKILIS